MQVIYELYCRERFITDKEVREIYKKNIRYVLAYSILHFPLLLLIMYSSFREFEMEERYFEICVNIITSITCSIPFIIGIVKLGSGFPKLKKIKEIHRRLTKSLNK